MLRPTAWIIPRLESRSFTIMETIHDEQGVHETVASKLRAVHRFYKKLFTPKPQDVWSEEVSAVLLSSVRRQIEPATRHALEAPFTVEELRAALKRACDLSAPGMDGVTYPLLDATSAVSLPRLCAMANALFRGHPLPKGEPSLRGVLLPKKGNLSNLGNYRPLSIAAVTFRILGAAVAQGLQRAAQEVISVSQSGFILGRHSARNVITLYLLLHATQTGMIEDTLWVLNLDQQKAYDHVRREWLLDCLATYGFGPRFLTYVRKIYRHPTLRHCVEGFFTEQIALKCGILQGDPMSCLLYYLSLQPMLDFAQDHHHASTKLRWDTTSPLSVSSLAFADDVLLIVNNKADLAKFLDTLDLYEMASNARVNEDKSQAFFFTRSPDTTGDLSPDDIPFPVIGQSDTEIVHLGYPFRLDGGVPSQTIEKRLSSIRTKVNILCMTKTTLVGQVRICNSFLLSKLWHTICLCPISSSLQHDVNAIVNPFLFLGRRNWIKHEYAIAPRHLGGLGVIDTHQMGHALLGQMVAGLLINPEPIGAQFRQALQEHLWTQYGATPAHFLLRCEQPWLQMTSIVTAQKSFMCRVVAAAGRLLPAIWRELWAHLNPVIARRLLEISKHYRIHPDNSISHKNPLPHDRPFDIDTIGLPFPWRFASLAGRPAAEYTVRHAHSFLARNDAITPDWPFDSTEAQWRQVWLRHTQDNLLTSEATSDVFLLHRRPWLAQKARGDLRLANYNGFDNNNTAAHTLLFDHNSGTAATEPPPENDAYTTDHVFGVSSCMLCDGPLDSAIHRFIDCPTI
ncbi:hypothetical protein NDA13_004523 [Ustilago tritici]|nr:hypothetical protein NDA13_004523 [Ustilago tritici]